MDPYLLLAAAEGCGPAPVAALLEPDADPDELLRRPPGVPPAVRRRLADPAGLRRRARAWLEAAARAEARVLTPACADYPGRFRARPLRPLVLFLRGAPRALEHRSVTVVGSRTPTPYGLAACADFVGAAARAGLGVWSGLARGLDACAHRHALELDAPTVAVLAGGLDRIYPAGHEALARRIVERGGCLLSEIPPGVATRRGHFPRRNRLLAAGGEAVLVVEAGVTSGALYTARFAAEAGVPVFALPGPYTSSRSRGCHDLIADGACIARDPEDLLRCLDVAWTMRGEDGPSLAAGADRQAILSRLESGPRPADLVLRESRLEPKSFVRALHDLMRLGLVRTLPGDLIARNAPLSPERNTPGSA